MLAHPSMRPREHGSHVPVVERRERVGVPCSKQLSIRSWADLATHTLFMAQLLEVCRHPARPDDPGFALRV
jgi:hypothetical protein